MTIEEKLRHFYDTSVDEAKEEAAREIEAHKKMLEDMLEKHKQSGRQNAEADLKAEAENVRREVNKALSSEQITLKRDMSKKQNELKDKLFEDVRERLEQFMETPQYEDYLCEKIRVAKKFAGEDELHIYLSASDKERRESLIQKSRFPLEVSKSSFIGGIRATIPGKNILIDNSFEDNFIAVKKEFQFDGGLMNE